MCVKRKVGQRKSPNSHCCSIKFRRQYLPKYQPFKATIIRRLPEYHYLTYPVCEKLEIQSTCLLIFGYYAESSYIINQPVKQAKTHGECYHFTDVFNG